MNKRTQKQKGKWEENGGKAYSLTIGAYNKTGEGHSLVILLLAGRITQTVPSKLSPEFEERREAEEPEEKVSHHKIEHPAHVVRDKALCCREEPRDLEGIPL